MFFSTHSNKLDCTSLDKHQPRFYCTSKQECTWQQRRHWQRRMNDNKYGQCPDYLRTQAQTSSVNVFCLNINGSSCNFPLPLLRSALGVAHRTLHVVAHICTLLDNMGPRSLPFKHFRVSLPPKSKNQQLSVRLLSRWPPSFPRPRPPPGRLQNILPRLFKVYKLAYVSVIELHNSKTPELMINEDSLD